jgi:hypothetical protein
MCKFGRVRLRILQKPTIGQISHENDSLGGIEKLLDVFQRFRNVFEKTSKIASVRFLPG